MSLIHSLLYSDIVSFCETHNAPKYRADQIWDWLYVKNVSSFEQMKNIPTPLKETLSKNFSMDSAIAYKTNGDLGDTQKILAQLQDGECVEEVLLPDRERRTVCLSCQAGCKFNCSFCASGKSGFSRNLEAGEMVGQLLLAGRIFDQRISNVVFMGTGEPFDNYNEVLKAIAIINDQKGIGIGARKITISTCGIIPGIQKLADEKLQIELSVSLHASSDNVRSRLMPINKTYPLKALIAACDSYTEKTGRIITFEYSMISGINDSIAQAHELAELLRPLHCRMNILLLSPTEDFDAQPASHDTATKFMEILKDAGVNSTLRNSKGISIRAACGQLRYKKTSG